MVHPRAFGTLGPRFKSALSHKVKIKADSFTFHSARDSRVAWSILGRSGRSDCGSNPRYPILFLFDFIEKERMLSEL